MHSITFIPFIFSFISLTNLISSLEINGKTITLNNASDFIELSDNVSNGTSYGGSTVVLGADIDFSGLSDEFNTIGLIKDKHILIFRGIFDGQGHVIRNLVMKSSLNYVGLFGIINGTSFKNVVVDSSCSITSTFNYTSRTGLVSIIGYIIPTETTASVSGCVNMANITSNVDIGSASEALVGVGGIIGGFKTDSYDLEVKNCVNYGTLTDSGECQYALIGGIISVLGNGVFEQAHGCSVKNCANYGKMIYAGKGSFMLSIGGIIGAPFKSIIENCINYGIFTTCKESSALGKIVGAADTNTIISNCFWTNEEDSNKTHGFNYRTEPTVTNSYHVESNTTTVSTLNDWVKTQGEQSEREYTQWMMLHLNGGRMGMVREDTLIVPQKPFPDPVKEGCAFAQWCTDSDCASGEWDGTFHEGDGNLYAKWNHNNYTVTFDFGNGTLVSSTLEFNTTITYPDAPKKKGFYGWNSSIERVPAYDLVIGPNTIKPEKKSNKSNAGAIAGGIIGGVAITGIAVIIIVLIAINKKKMRKDYISMEYDQREYVGLSNIYPRVVEKNENISEITFSSEHTNKIVFYVGLYPETYHIPSLIDALTDAGIDKSLVDEAITKCSLTAENAKKEGYLFDGFTTEDAMAVALYTYDFGPGLTEMNPYMLINKALTGEINGDLKKVRGLLYVVMSALRKLPRWRGKTAYRGIQKTVNVNEYKEGSIVTFHGITSTSTNMSTVKDFLIASGSDGGESSGTLFVIEDGWGYDVQPYSLFPNEKEIILEPERCFQVDSVIQSEVTVVNLKMLDTPLILPKIFGEGNKSSEYDS